MDMYLGKPDTDSNIVWHRPQSNSCRIEDELIQKSIRALSSTKDPVERLRLLCLTHGAAGILGFCRLFRRVENDGNKMNKEEFINGIKNTGVKLSEREADELFDLFDLENNGTIRIDEFLSKIRPPMSENRRLIVEQAFRKLDKAGDGHITIDDIRGVYAVTSHPTYMSGEETKDTIMTKFLSNFEIGGTVDGKVTLQEFMDYYSGLSVSIDKDSYFDLMVRQAYRL